MRKNLSALLLAFCMPLLVSAQNRKSDTLAPAPLLEFISDSTLDYDFIFNDFERFMDSILMPKSYFLASVTAGKGFFNFQDKTSFTVNSVKKLSYSPTLAYYHKSGWGLSGMGYLVDDGRAMGFYQGLLSPSYDYMANRRLATGISYTRYFTRDSLSFYTTPVQNELYGYFTWRESWLRPMLAMTYGWGSRTDLEQRETLIQDLRLRRRGFIYINNTEKVSEFSLMLSVRHDFYWLSIFTGKDFIRFTPQFAFTSGTQRFGFNQSSATYGTSIRTGANILFNADNLVLDETLKFQPLSVGLMLRGEYAVGKFFFQPQLTLDHYLPGASRKVNALFALSAGFIF